MMDMAPQPGNPVVYQWVVWDEPERCPQISFYLSRWFTIQSTMTGTVTDPLLTAELEQGITCVTLYSFTLFSPQGLEAKLETF